ncbi:hypothetical protein SKAU_G00252540 [Synaphobranchus kaupii]|uniref:Uncharacterized protein n=1 Tax=Synaphobranchus kaupii TaxID=118154 RepID=A0A9Q1F348_SYNKA|nr:hypothetical protein SKAU_G00252540 [Synaphobranchus kaupii]
MGCDSSNGLRGPPGSRVTATHRKQPFWLSLGLSSFARPHNDSASPGIGTLSLLVDCRRELPSSPAQMAVHRRSCSSSVAASLSAVPPL